MSATVRPKKSLGQHFLRDDEVHEDILRWCRLTAEDRILEIGAGDGTLTRSLGEEAALVIALETDRRCLRLLRKEFPEGGRVRVVEADILRYDFSPLEPLAPLKVVGDLPYNIATAILNLLLDRASLFPLMILMFQLEVARRLAADCGSRSYGSLSLAVQYRAEVDLLRTVPPEAFVPPPKVTSALVRIRPRPAPLLSAGAEKVFEGLLRSGFSHRRKTFLNSLARSSPPVPPPAVAAAMEELSLPLRCRAEDLGLEDFLGLARRLASPAGGGS